MISLKLDFQFVWNFWSNMWSFILADKFSKSSKSLIFPFKNDHLAFFSFNHPYHSPVTRLRQSCTNCTVSPRRAPLPDTANVALDLATLWICLSIPSQRCQSRRFLWRSLYCPKIIQKVSLHTWWTQNLGLYTRTQSGLKFWASQIFSFSCMFG